jgi:hypothetical protein
MFLVWCVNDARGSVIVWQVYNQWKHRQCLGYKIFKLFTQGTLRIVHVYNVNCRILVKTFRRDMFPSSTVQTFRENWRLHVLALFIPEWTWTSFLQTYLKSQHNSHKRRINLWFLPALKHRKLQSELTRWRSWLRHCATSRKALGSIPDGVFEIIYWLIFPAAL